MASAFVHCSQLTDENHSNPAFRVCPSSAAEAHFRPLLRLSESEGERRPRPRFRLLERQREDPGLERPRAPIRHHRVEELRQLHRNLSVEADAQGTAAAVRHAHAPVDGCRCEATLPAPLGGRSPRPRAWRRRARTLPARTEARQHTVAERCGTVSRIAAAVAARKVVAAAVCRRRRPVPPPRRGCPRRVWRQLFETKVDVGLASAAALAPHAPRHVHVAVDRQPAQPGGESERLGSFVARPRAQRAHLVDVDADADPAVGGARLSEGVRLACAAGSQLLHRLRRRRAQRLRSAWRAARHHVA
mmetsp:Transcript_23868/g.76601  ORF Transcript_23868/g.76601 Transcript_23868/m.76601 type:complete len:303 (+) Transcript_23868:117-1025(+)